MVVDSPNWTTYQELAEKILLQFFHQGLHEPRLHVLVLVVPERRAVNLAEVADLLVERVGREDPDGFGTVDLL